MWEVGGGGGGGEHDLYQFGGELKKVTLHIIFWNSSKKGRGVHGRLPSLIQIGPFAKGS